MDLTSFSRSFLCT